MGYVPLILVAEDDEVNRELIKDILSEYGYRVREAHNGKDAVEKALEEVPDLILMDIEMPVMNGLDAIKMLMDREETNRVPIIVLTGLNETEDRIKAFDCGAMDFVSKPFNAHELLSHVRSYLRFSLLNKKYVLSTLNSDTQLPNRAAFREKISNYEEPVLFLIKIDNIEAISRFYGDATGTEIEINFSNFLLKQGMETCDPCIIYHLDRGLFGLLSDNSALQMDKDNARAFSQDILDKFKTHQTTEKDAQYDIELTMGICFQKENILEKSELALEEAMRNKTGIMVVDDMIQDVYHTIGENIFWLKKIKEAVQEKRFVPFYQPILNASTGKVEKFESLLRMVDEKGEIISPGKFLLIAKNSKYYPDITRAITRQSLERFKNRPEGFSVNLSALDIENRDMREFLLEAIRQSPDAASRLTFEIVEQEGVKHIEVLKQFVRQVKQHGVKIAIDDFGSGYSNFRMLMDMDVDFIKIDGSLIRNINTDANSRSVVETIKTFADKTSIGIIAEFVENQEIYDCLKEMGIYYLQGYFIGKPALL
jgi:EAL domain-containing protein (putative c-di-GMP-specific phosphodiesterase class I)/DNA-binding NarL/FixJ family response regulator